MKEKEVSKMAAFISFVLSCISLGISAAIFKKLKQGSASAPSECKNALNSRVVSAVKQYDKKGMQVVYCAVKLDGEELEHILVNIQDLSSISAAESDT